jgi:hypothetical protein
MNTHRLIIKIFSAPSPHCSIRQTSPSMLMHGSVPWSLSLHCCLRHAQTRTRHSSQLNNFAAPPAYGGTITIPCSRLVMSSHGTNSGPLSERTTFQRDSLSDEFLNLTQEPALLCNMHRSSITCANMRVISRILMPVSEIVSVEA